MNSSVPLNRTLMITRTWPCGGSVVNKTLLSAAWHLFGGRCDRICRRHGRLFAARHLCGGLGAALFFTSVTAPCWSVGVQINVNTIEDHCLLLQTEAFFSHWALKETFVLNKSVALWPSWICLYSLFELKFRLYISPVQVYFIFWPALTALISCLIVGQQAVGVPAQRKGNPSDHRRGERQEAGRQTEQQLNWPKSSLIPGFQINCYLQNTQIGLVCYYTENVFFHA